jgi:hypothetical protein
VIIAHTPGVRAPGNGTDPQGACACNGTQNPPQRACIPHPFTGDPCGQTAADQRHPLSWWQAWGLSPEGLEHHTVVTLPAPEPLSSAGGFLWPSRSQRPQNAQHLAREVALHWPRPATKAPPWLRESFPSRRPPATRLWAFTTDSRGRVVRAFTAGRLCIAAYAELQRTQCGTCPIEAVWPPSIAVGQPAEPAHRYLLQLQEVAQ